MTNPRELFVLLFPLSLGGLALACNDSKDSGGDAGGAAGESNTANGGESASGGSSNSGGSSSSGGGSGEGAACIGLCQGFGYTGGTEQNFDDMVIECLCDGAGSAIEQDECSEYCSEFDVPAQYSYLSSQNDDGQTDKCVCDKTAL